MFSRVFRVPVRCDMTHRGRRKFCVSKRNTLYIHIHECINLVSLFLGKTNFLPIKEIWKRKWQILLHCLWIMNWKAIHHLRGSRRSYKPLPYDCRSLPHTHDHRAHCKPHLRGVAACRPLLSHPHLHMQTSSRYKNIPYWKDLSENCS